MAAYEKAIEYASDDVSTHSHPKVAAGRVIDITKHGAVSTHSHPKVAAPVYLPVATVDSVSTHSHPKVAADFLFGS